MKRLSRDSWLAIGLLLLLLLITIFAAVQQTQAGQQPPLASFSNNPDGARALALWLAEVGYTVNSEVSGTFQIPRETGLVLMLEPQNLLPTEWPVIDDWVEEGGTLLIAGDQFGAAVAARHYDFTIGYVAEPISPLTGQTPLLTSPPLNAAEVNTQAYYRTRRDDFVTHLAIEAGPVVVSFNEGNGQVILSAAPFPFSNAGLKETGNPALILNLISAAGDDLVWFDEWHHGLRVEQAEIIGPANWLRYTPAGRALLFVAAVIFIGLVLGGRRFGRPVPLPQENARRGPLEYVTAIANLSRRAGHRAAVLQDYHHRLKRGLGWRYRLNPTLPDEDYLARLAQLNPALDIDALRTLLTRLQHRTVSESELVDLARQSARWLEERS